MSSKAVSILWLSVVIFLNFQSTDAKINVYNEVGEIVDWVVLIKLPTSKSSGNSSDYSNFMAKGAAYTYVTNIDISIGWQLSKKSLNDSNSIPGRTFAQIYDNVNSKNVGYLCWNVNF